MTYAPLAPSSSETALPIPPEPPTTRARLAFQGRAFALRRFHAVISITAVSRASARRGRGRAGPGGSFAVLLCRAEEGGNVGSACRAMKTMGLSRLVLVGCPEYPVDRVRTMAVHAFDVFESAELFPDLASALAASPSRRLYESPRRAPQGLFAERRGFRRDGIAPA